MVLVVALAFAIAQASSPGEAAIPHRVPEWIQRASGQDLARVYPRSARRRGVEGIALVSCRVTADGAMADCKVEQEAPLHEGFGDAALELMPLFRMRSQADGGAPVEGGTVRLPIQFRLPR